MADGKNDYLRFLFSGHWGSGKSSELEQLRRALETGEVTPPGRGRRPYKRCFPVL